MEAATSTDTREAIFALLPPIFRDFVDAETARYDLSTPFVVDGYVYATDGRSIVRMPVTPEVVAAFDAHDRAAPGKRRIKKPDSVFGGTFQPDPTPMPVPNLPTCRWCEGKGTIPEETCDGCGGEALRAGFSCEWCGGKGITPASPCDECGGFGSGENYQDGVPLNQSLWLSHRFVHLIHRHKASVYMPTSGTPPYSPIRFTAGDAEGRFMGMTKPR